MRVLNERFADARRRPADGIKIFDARGWLQVLPDGDEPLVHLYAEGETPAAPRSWKLSCARSSGPIEREEIGAAR